MLIDMEKRKVTVKIHFLAGNPFRRQLWCMSGRYSYKGKKVFMWWKRKRSESFHQMCKLHLLDDLLALI